MKKNKNIPLNLKEQINSRIGLICSIVVMLLLVLVFHQLDYQLIQKPADQAAKEAAKQKEEAEQLPKLRKFPLQLLSQSVTISFMIH